MKLRPADLGDAATLLGWRNDPTTRSMSLEQGEVSLENHESWLAAKLADPRCEIWIGTVDERPVGQVRFDLVEQRVAIVSISVDAAARGTGLGIEILTSALAETALEPSTVRALVRPENTASLRLFERCGFTTKSRSQDQAVFELLTVPRRA